MTGKLVASLVYLLVGGAFYAWVHLRVRVLRGAGATDEARRRFQWNTVIFVGTFLLLVGVLLAPHNAKGWVGVFGFVGIFGALGFLMIQNVRRAVQMGRQRRIMREQGRSDPT